MDASHYSCYFFQEGIISVAIGGKGSGGTNEVAILIVIIVILRISTKVVVAKGIIISVDFGFVFVSFACLDDAVAMMDTFNISVIVGSVFGCRVMCASDWGWGTVLIHLRKEMMIVTFEIVIYVVFVIVIAVVVVVVVNCEGPTLSGLALNHAVGIIIICVDEARDPIIVGVRS